MHFVLEGTTSMNVSLLYGDVQVDLEISLIDTSIEVRDTEDILRQTQCYRAEMYDKLIHYEANGTLTFTEHHGRGRECGNTLWEHFLDRLVDTFQILEGPPLWSCDK